MSPLYLHPIWKGKVFPSYQFFFPHSPGLIHTFGFSLLFRILRSYQTKLRYRVQDLCDLISNLGIPSMVRRRKCPTSENDTDVQRFRQDPNTLTRVRVPR